LQRVAVNGYSEISIGVIVAILFVVFGPKDPVVIVGINYGRLECWLWS
jgi:hypothetical protein